MTSPPPNEPFYLASPYRMPSFSSSAPKFPNVEPNGPPFPEWQDSRGARTPSPSGSSPMVSTYPGGNFPSIPTPQPPKEISARHEDHIGEEYIYCGVRYKVYAPETTPPVDHVPAAPDARIRDLVTKISKAVDGVRTDYNTLTDTLVRLNTSDMNQVSNAYVIAKGKNLLKMIETQTGAAGSWYKFGMSGVVCGPALWDLNLIYRACAGAGTDEQALIEILLNRPDSDIYLLKWTYKNVYKKDLELVMGTELRSNLLNIFRSALIGNRDKDVEPSYTSIADEHKAWHSKVDEDVQSISWYMEHAKTGTSTELLCKILVMRNQAQLRGIVKLYRERYHTNLSDALAKIYSGDMKLALTYIAKGAEGDGDGVDRDADLLHDAMKGMGTKDEELTRRIVRGHWDHARFQEVEKAFHGRQGKSLEKRVKSETSGPYRDLLLAIVNL